MEEKIRGIVEHDELLANVRRLTHIVLDRLGDGIKDGTLDPGQMRMLGSLAVRSLRLWHQVVGKQPVREWDREREALSAAGDELARDLDRVPQDGVET